jgi:sodium/pantothenate symporter
MAIGFKPFGLHQIVIGITVAFLLMVIGSYLGKPSDEKRLEAFFPQR